MNLEQILPGTSQFVIEKLEYFPVARHNPMYMRPYTFNVQQESVHTIADRLDQTRAGKVTPALLKGVTSGIMQPSVVGYETIINDSWASTKRFIFMMKVRHIDISGVELNTYLIGYTEYDGITPNGHIDTQMPHFINNVISTTVHTWSTPMGVIRQEKLADTYQAIYSMSNVDMYTQRPVDIYNAISAVEMAEFSQMPVNLQTTSGMVNPFNNNVVSSTLENNISTEYLAKILTSGMHATKAREIHMNSYQMGSDDPTEKFFSEPSVSETAFVRYLSRISGYKSVRPIFNFQHLMQIDPTIYERFIRYNITDEVRDPTLAQTPEVGDFWSGQDLQTMKAYALVENAVSMATKHGFTKMSFSATNMDNPLGQSNVYILNFKSFVSVSEQDMNYLLEMFKEKFLTEVFLNETNGGRMPLNMECHVNLLGTSKIYLEWPGYHGNWYTVPTFAGSAYSPVISLDQAAVDNAAFQLNNVLGTLVQAQQPSFY